LRAKAGGVSKFMSGGSIDGISNQNKSKKYLLREFA